MSIGLITAAALIPANPVPRPAPIPAKKVTIIVKNNDDIIYIPPCFAKQNATAHAGAEVFTSLFCEAKCDCPHRSRGIYLFSVHNYNKNSLVSGAHRP